MVVIDQFGVHKMKKFLLASTVLVASSGLAFAEVTLSGDARMGIIDDFNSADFAFTSRARVEFTLSGETDGGLAFGASFRADNAADSAVCVDADFSGVYESSNADGIDECDFVAGGAESGAAGSVFISGAFGRLSMGDVDGAALAAVGHVDGVGLTGLDDLNETDFFANGGDFGTNDPSALYEYSVGSLSLYLSATNLSGIDEAQAVGVKYAINDAITVSAGYEHYDIGFGGSDTQYILGADATFGTVTLKARYADSNFDTQQTSVSATYTADALAVTGFYMDNGFNGYEAFGLGAAYDLGGGAKIVGGYVDTDSAGDQDAFDLGVSFEF